MRVLICGSRDWTDDAPIHTVLSAFDGQRDELIHGAAGGADTIAADFAAVLGMMATAFPADWNKQGRGAGVIRNQRMLDEGKPDVVWAFTDNNSRGTADMVRRARGADVPTYVVSHGRRES